MKTLKQIQFFDIDNQTSVEVTQSLDLVFSCQNYYKNGKPKGKPFLEFVPYYFDNAESYNTFMLKHSDIPQTKQKIMIFTIRDGCDHDSDYLIKNMNKI